MSGLQQTSSVDFIIIADIRRLVWLIETVEDEFQRDLDLGMKVTINPWGS